MEGHFWPSVLNEVSRPGSMPLGQPGELRAVVFCPCLLDWTQSHGSIMPFDGFAKIWKDWQSWPARFLYDLQGPARKKACGKGPWILVIGVICTNLPVAIERGPHIVVKLTKKLTNWCTNPLGDEEIFADGYPLLEGGCCSGNRPKYWSGTVGESWSESWP